MTLAFYAGALAAMQLQIELVNTGAEREQVIAMLQDAYDTCTRELGAFVPTE